MDGVSAGPAKAPLTPEEREARKARALADLRQSMWEASQFMTTPEIADFTVGVLNETQSDEV